jgi:hypothetical protein
MSLIFARLPKRADLAILHPDSVSQAPLLQMLDQALYEEPVHLERSDLTAHVLDEAGSFPGLKPRKPGRRPGKECS